MSAARRHLSPFPLALITRAVLSFLLLASSARAQIPDGRRSFNEAARPATPAVRIRARRRRTRSGARAAGRHRKPGQRRHASAGRPHERAERRAVAEFVTGKTIGGDVTGAEHRPLRTRRRPLHNIDAGPRVGRLESDDHQHAISIRASRPGCRQPIVPRLR